ncbi:MAG: nicotinate (nicotinamide) nucleotide adenylyltransferase [bacterium]|nr:nicotinate (nicotinamide) nucleotide adenylyltransferase [bacterium]
MEAAVGESRPASERLGVFGGTFDPPHIGHLAAAEAARYALELDRVLFVVANVPWQKVPEQPVSAAADRLALVRAAVEDLEGFEVSALEIDKGGESSTAETLTELAGSGRELFLIVGSDLADSLDSWRRPGVIRSLATVAVVARLGSTGPGVPPPGWDWVGVEGPGIEVSSTHVRRWLAEGQALGSVLSRPVAVEIERRRLYR